MDLNDLVKTIKKNLTWDKILEYGPVVLIGGAALYGIDRAAKISNSLKESGVADFVKRYNRNDFFEGIDTVGDIMELVNSLLAGLGIDIGKDNIKKIADFLQKLGNSGKIIDLIVGTFERKGLVKRNGNKLSYTPLRR